MNQLVAINPKRLWRNHVDFFGGAIPCHPCILRITTTTLSEGDLTLAGTPAETSHKLAPPRLELTGSVSLNYVKCTIRRWFEVDSSGSRQGLL